MDCARIIGSLRNGDSVRREQGQPLRETTATARHEPSVSSLGPAKEEYLTRIEQRKLRAEYIEILRNVTYSCQ